VDRFGGRTAFLLSLLIVTAACAAGGLATGLTSLVAIYSTNRFFGAAAWGSMVKQVPDWFPRSLLARAISVLCLSYVLGGACAVWVAGRIAALSGNNWRAVMALPAVLLGIVGILCWVTLPKPTSQTTAD
jgi:sugar phosphate permease